MYSSMVFTHIVTSIYSCKGETGVAARDALAVFSLAPSGKRTLKFCTKRTHMKHPCWQFFWVRDLGPCSCSHPTKRLDFDILGESETQNWERSQLFYLINLVSFLFLRLEESCRREDGYFINGFLQFWALAARFFTVSGGMI